jgi:hypothetical protein
MIELLSYVIMYPRRDQLIYSVEQETQMTSRRADPVKEDYIARI